MTIYTSYFANIKNLPKDVVPISIAGKCPDWYNGFQYKKLAPKYEWWKIWKDMDPSTRNNFYIEKYNETVLGTMTQEEVVNELTSLSGGKDVVLLCYEKPSDFCHRHLVSKWLAIGGINCYELRRTKKW